MSTLIIKVDEGDQRKIDQIIRKLAFLMSGPGVRRFAEGPALVWFRKSIEWNFAQEKSPMNRNWRQLKKVTQRIRLLQGFPPDHPINVRTGQMKNFSLNTHTIKVAPMLVQLVVPEEQADPELQRKIQHAQLGGVSKWGKPFPARPIFGIRRADAKEITENMAGWMRSMLMTGGDV